jgi:hypothetical protein
MEVESSKHKKMRNAYKILGGKTERKETFERPIFAFTIN